MQLQIAGLSAIDVFTMSNFYDPDSKLVVLNRIYDTILSLTDSIPFLAGQLLATRWPGVVCKHLDPLENSLQIFLGYYTKVFLYGFSEIDFIYGHLS